MLGVILGYALVMITAGVVRERFLRCAVLYSSCLLAFISPLMFSSGRVISGYFFLDYISYPLLSLSSLVVFLSVLASKTFSSSLLDTRGYFICLLLVGLFLFPCFLIKSFLGFFVFFEASVLPLMVLMTRWGSQKARVQASLYFVFYTMVGSFPLLVFFLSMFSELGSSYIGMKSLSPVLLTNLFIKGSPLYKSLWWAGMLGFLMKLPIYGLHLWLPKAHVEAPVAGSMLLAALLLKLGGYGLIRVNCMMSSELVGYVMSFCFFGSAISSLICLRQTDLKSLMAYSSVGHMSLVAGGVLLKSSWGVSGALMLMVSHGLVSSCLFSLANLVYERSGTRTLSVTRGISGVSSLVALWWMLSCASNLGLPPLPSFVGELFLVLSAIDLSVLYISVLGLSLIFSSLYSLFIYQKTCNSSSPKFFFSVESFKCREHFLMFSHLFPLVLILGNPSLCLC